MTYFCLMRRPTLALALLLAACSAEQAPFQPGQWAFTFKISELQQPVFWGGGGNCIDASEAAELPALVLSQTPLGQCRSTKSSYANEKISLEAVCDGKAAATRGPEATVTAAGSYTPTRFDIDLKVQMEIDGPARELVGILNAHRVGKCAAQVDQKKSNSS